MQYLPEEVVVGEHILAVHAVSKFAEVVNRGFIILVFYLSLGFGREFQILLEIQINAQSSLDA